MYSAMFEGSRWESGNVKDSYELYKKGGRVRLLRVCRFSFKSTCTKKVRFRELGNNMDANVPDPCRDGGASDSSGGKPQDADYASLSYELEGLILARFPKSEYWKVSLLNKRCLDLVKSGQLSTIRREIGVKEPSVFVSSGDNVWWAFDGEFKSGRELPILYPDFCFVNGDKESFCAGTHLLVSGKEFDGLVTWRYELDTNEWHKGQGMINPRCLFASATCGDYAFVAGGIGAASSQVYDSAEKYDSVSKSWTPLPMMNRQRMLCAGCYMDGKFYVIGGRNQDGELTCGEYYDEGEDKWEVIPDMLKDDPVQKSHAPPLLAVVSNELYALESSSNRLKVYLKATNKWKLLGPVPVRANSRRGWGVAFKSLGDELLVIGESAASSASMLSVYTCCPHPDGSKLRWRPLDSGTTRLSHFIMNCCVMMT